VGAPRRRLSHENRVLLTALAGGAPALALALWLLLRATPGDPLTHWTVAAALVLVWLAFAFAVRGRVTRPLQTISNMLAALREHDFSTRAHGADTRSALGLALWEVNALTDTLRRQRLDTIEATALLRHVMDVIDVAVFAFDEAGHLQLVNQAGERLLGEPAERLRGRAADELGLADALTGETPRLVELRLPGRTGRWEVRRGAIRQEGRPHHLVVLSDLTRSLREEEREAWLRLVRVLSHEINNSLAPIQSIAGSLRGSLERPGGAVPADLREGLAVIEGRAQSLGRFMTTYARLTRLPRPTLGRVDLAGIVRRAAALETRLRVRVDDGPPVALEADADQLEQLFINLVRNAADAALETGGDVRVSWDIERGRVEVRVEDDGPGLADTGNLFVPFFTTKPEGSGIGLVVSRQIAEAHGGSVSLANRVGARGAVARVRLPLGARAGDGKS
jgi:PAS domain S-box-containing protein